MNDPSTKRALVLGWTLLAVCVPLGMTLEALHAMKLAAFLESPLRRDMWRLAHAHGNLLGIVCLVFASLGERAVPDAAARRSISNALCIGAILMPLGFFLGGILRRESDPSLGILLVPLAALFLLYALARAALSSRNGSS